jgi:signal transduction histidine kinase
VQVIRRGLNAIGGWLGRAPLTDDIERRNAPFLQLVLMYFGTIMPFNLVYYWFRVDRHYAFDTGVLLNISTDIAVILAAWTGVWLIRRGRLRGALVLFLYTLITSLALSYTYTGLRSLVIDPTFPVLSLTLGGLVLGRRALWTVFGFLLLALAMGALSDLVREHFKPGPAAYSPSWMPTTVMLYVIIAVVLDRTILALRNSLDEATRRSVELAQANQELTREMAERERAQEKLIHAQKMEAVGRIASGLTHDFDNVLNVVLGFATRRQRLAALGTEALVDALAGIETAARRALSVSRQLLDFSRQEPSRPEVFDAVAALVQVRPMLRQLFDGEVRVQFELAEQPLRVRMDRGQFELMTLNIAANARDVMPDGGTFTVSARPSNDATVLELSFADTGFGMPEDVRAKVFEPFYTTKPAGHGTGLGLAVVRDLVHAAKGVIWAESAPLQGTVFFIRLPLAEPAHAGTAADGAGQALAGEQITDAARSQ